MTNSKSLINFIKLLRISQFTLSGLLIIKSSGFNDYTFLRSIIWESDLSYRIKQSFFPVVAVSILLYRCTTSVLKKKNSEKKVDGNYTKMLRTVWKQHFIKQQLYDCLLHISQTIKIRQTRHAGHRWRSKN